MDELGYEAMMNMLSPRERDVIEMRAVARMTYKEIAVVMDSNPTNMQHVYKRALGKLQGITVKRRNGMGSQATSDHGTGWRCSGNVRQEMRSSAVDMRRLGTSAYVIALVLRCSVTLVNELLREAGRHVGESRGT